MAITSYKRTADMNQKGGWGLENGYKYFDTSY